MKSVKSLARFHSINCRLTIVDCRLTTKKPASALIGVWLLTNGPLTTVDGQFIPRKSSTSALNRQSTIDNRPFVNPQSSIGNRQSAIYK